MSLKKISRAYFNVKQQKGEKSIFLSTFCHDRKIRRCIENKINISITFFYQNEQWYQIQSYTILITKNKIIEKKKYTMFSPY